MDAGPFDDPFDDPFDYPAEQMYELPNHSDARLFSIHRPKVTVQLSQPADDED